MKTIGVAIPCYIGHIPKIKNILDSIETQTVKPDNVIISCSSSTPRDIPPLPRYSFQYQIVTTLERHNTAQNRNKAAKLLNTDVITFIDVDDVMHPQRIEILKSIEDADMIVHEFSNTDSFVFEKYELPVNNRYITLLDKAPFVNAHTTVSSQVFRDIQFNESTDFELNADSEFCERVLQKYITVFVPLILSKGTASYTCYFEKGVSVVLRDVNGNTMEIHPPPKEKKRSMFSFVSR